MTHFILTDTFDVATREDCFCGEFPLTPKRRHFILNGSLSKEGHSTQGVGVNSGIISGTINKPGTIVLLDKITREQISRFVSTNGYYKFFNLDPLREYIVIAIPNDPNFNAIVWDQINPV